MRSEWPKLESDLSLSRLGIDLIRGYPYCFVAFGKCLNIFNCPLYTRDRSLLCCCGFTSTFPTFTTTFPRFLCPRPSSPFLIVLRAASDFNQALSHVLQKTKHSHCSARLCSNLRTLGTWNEAFRASIVLLEWLGKHSICVQLVGHEWSFSSL